MKPCIREGGSLLNDLLDFIADFRTNDYVLLADTAKAFLNIRLNKDDDKNKFSFVVYRKGQYRYFRYNSIIFEFVTCPFI